MNKAIYFIFTTILLSSCSKSLDIPNDGRISMDDAFADRFNTMAYLNTIFNYRTGINLNRTLYTNDAHDARDVIAGSAPMQYYVGNSNATRYISSDGQPWNHLFEGIRKCNIFISRVPDATINVSDTERAGWIGQARILRAFSYLQLIMRYGSVPLLTQPLPINHDFSSVTKAPVSAVVTQILQDCDFALALPNDEYGFPWHVSGNAAGMMTRAIAYTIKSEAMLFAVSPLFADGTYSWADAALVSKEALDQCLANDYKLFDIQPATGFAQNAYANYFLTTNRDRSIDKETIFGITPVSIWKDHGLPSTPEQTSAGISPTQDLVDCYEMSNGQPILDLEQPYLDENRLIPNFNPASGYDPEHPYLNRDPRFYASIYYNGAQRRLNGDADEVETFINGKDGISETSVRNTRTGYYIRKYNYWGSSSSNQNDGSMKHYRLAQLYLNFAEAAYQSVDPYAKLPSVVPSGSPMSAADAVNAIRQRAGLPNLPEGLSKEQFEKRYRNERRVEFAFEEVRYFDVRRWKTHGSSFRNFVTGMRIQRSSDGDLTYTRFKFDNRPADDKYLLYPIPQGEVNKMLHLTGQNWQNPGWQ